jgi:hypothetical protein
VAAAGCTPNAVTGNIGGQYVMTQMLRLSGTGDAGQPGPEYSPHAGVPGSGFRGVQVFWLSEIDADGRSGLTLWMSPQRVMDGIAYIPCFLLEVRCRTLAMPGFHNCALG